jgi:hypothetical protein
MPKKFSNGWMLKEKEKDCNVYYNKKASLTLLLRTPFYYIEVVNYSITGLSHLSASSKDIPLRLA